MKRAGWVGLATLLAFCQLLSLSSQAKGARTKDIGEKAKSLTWQVPWDRVEQLTPHSVRLFYASGLPECYKMTLFVIERQVITIALTSQLKPGVTGCADMAFETSRVVTLRTAINGRQFVKG